eukprot:XP_028345719.1 uncharacterized protein LOC114486297 [Physeter catodon]
MSIKERGKEQDDIKQYCETHQLPQLLAFLVNQLAHKKDPHPKLFCVKYFADRVSDSDLGTIGLYRSAPSEKDSTCVPGGVKILEDDDSVPFRNPFQADITMWMSRIPPSAWLRLGEVRTTNNLGALHCIGKTEEDSCEEGLSMDADAGVKALSAECYDAFHPLYSEFFRFVDATPSAKSLLTLPSFPVNAMKERIAACLPSSSMHSAISSLTLSFYRNFAQTPFPPTMNLSESNQIIARVRKGLEAWMALRQHTEEFMVIVKIDDPFDAEEIVRGFQDVFALFECLQGQEKGKEGDVFAKHRDFGYLTVDPLECRLGFSWWSGKVSCGFACAEDLGDYCNMSGALTSIVERYHNTQPAAYTTVIGTLAVSGEYVGCGISSEVWDGVSDVLKFYTECPSATSRRCGNLTQWLRDTGMHVEFSNFEKAVGLSTKVEKGTLLQINTVL